MIHLFLRFEWQKTLKYFKTKKLAKIITGILFLLVFGFLGVGIFAFFVTGFRYIDVIVDPDLRLPLILFLYEIFLLILAGIIVLSSIISSLYHLFQGKYDNWLMSSPGYKLFPKLILFKSLRSSSWPIIIMFLPAVLAFYKVYDFNILSLALILISSLFFLITQGTLAMLFVLSIATLYYFASKKGMRLPFHFKGLIGILIVITTSFIIYVWKTIHNLDLIKLFKADNADTGVSLAELSSYFTYLPTHPFATLMIDLQSGLLGEAFTNFALLFIQALVPVLLWWYVSPLFYPLWQKFQEGSTQTNKKSIFGQSTEKPYLFFGSSAIAVFKKEALVSSRNMKGVLWFLFLLCIWFAQIAAHVILSKNVHRYQTDLTQQISTIETLQFIIALYFISAFTLRFVFPSFSVERKTLWVLASAPLDGVKIFFGKYIFYIISFITLGMSMSVVSASILNASFLYSVSSSLLFISTIIFIVTLGLAMGALFPSTESDDPEVISTSMPGLFFTALALIYVALAGGTLYLTLTKNSFTFLVSFIIITLILVAVILLTVPARVKKIALLSN